MRYLVVACLGLCALVARPSLAQPPAGRPDVKKLESEVKALQDVLKEKEAALQKAKESDKKGFGFGKGPPPFAGKGFDPAKMKEMKEKFEKMAKEGDKKGFGPFGKGFDPAKMKEKFEAMKKEMDKKTEKKGPPEGKGPGGKGPPGFTRSKGRGFGPPGRGFTPPAQANRGSEIERRLDRLASEIEEIRKELKKRK